MGEAPDIVVAGGRVVLAEETRQADIAVKDGRIQALGPPGSFTPAGETIDAAGKLVMPGLVDSHVHIRWPFLNDLTRDDHYTGTVAAALGGTTTIIDFALDPRATPPEAVRARRAQMDGSAAVDYALTASIPKADPAHLDAMGPLADEGIAAFKAYMTYRKRGILADDAALYRMLLASKETGRLLGVHAENAAVGEYYEAQHLSEGKREAKYWPRCHPNFSEAEAVNRAMFLAGSADAGLLIRHITNIESIEVLRAARQLGLPFYGETQCQYLALDDRVFERPDGLNFVCSPPLRSEADAEALWAAVADGTVSVISTDHCAFDSAQKARASYGEVPKGLPGVETRLAVVYTAGVASGRISENRFVEVTSTNPAKLFGLYPRKGALAPGSDADIVVIDPEAEGRLTAEALHMVDWSPYEDMAVKGLPVTTLLRGEVISREGRFTGKKGFGEFLPAGPFAPPR